MPREFKVLKYRISDCRNYSGRRRRVEVWALLFLVFLFFCFFVFFVFLGFFLCRVCHVLGICYTICTLLNKMAGRLLDAKAYIAALNS